MLTPRIPGNETERLAELYRLNILDAESTGFFDNTVDMACRIFEVPICAISLLDTNRQWFLAQNGLNVCQTSRDVSFCGHTILAEEIMVVLDASQDPRFADNPLVVNEPNIRFYAGAPLVSRNNLTLGTLCIISDEPRSQPPQSLNYLKTLADAVVMRIEQRFDQSVELETV